MAARPIDSAGIDGVARAVIDRVCEIEDLLREKGAELLEPWGSDGERAGILN